MLMTSRSFVIISISLFLRGIDYGIVMPSMWRFLQELDPGVSEFYFGVTMSSFSAASMVFSPIFGVWLDRRPIKEVLLVLGMISVIGSVSYGISLNKWMVLASRILSGIGSIHWTGVSVYVVRSTKADERSQVFSVVNMLFVVALAAGPAINFPLTKIVGKYFFGPFNFSQLTAPGYVMAVLYICSFLSFFLFVEPQKSSTATKSSGGISDAILEFKQIFTNFPCVVVIITNLLSIFIQTSLEALVTPLTEEWYNLGTLYNSILYSGITVVMIVMYIVAGVMSTHFQDRVVLLSGHVLYGIGALLFIYFLSKSHNRNLYVPLWQFCVITGISAASIPMYDSTLNSLFSKLLNDEKLDGRGQSVLSSAASLGAILGPFVCGIFLSFDLHWLVVTTTGLWSVVLLMILFAWKKMWVQKITTVEDNNNDGEKEPLVINNTHNIQQENQNSNV